MKYLKLKKPFQGEGAVIILKNLKTYSKSVKRLVLIFTLCQLFLISNGQPWLEKLPATKSASGYTFFDYQKAFNDYWEPYKVDNKGYYIENGVKKKASGWKQFHRWEWDMEGKIDLTTGEFPTKSAQDVYEAYQKANHKAKSPKTANWSSVGPNSSDGGYAGIGRINCIAFHPSDTNTYWIGAPAGGLWVTTDNGTNWTCLTDNNGVLGISDIVIPSDYVSSNTIYIATGDRDGWDNRSVGVLKSTNAGTTWVNTDISYSLGDREMVSRLLLDPTDDNIIIAATTNGVYKTTNGGTTWTTQLTSSYFIDMEYKPGDYNTLYGSTESGSIYVSEDGGSVWTQTYNNSSAERIELAVTPANLAVVYAIASGLDNGLHAVYKSVDSGTNFTETVNGSTINMLGWNSDGGDLGGQGWYDLSIAVSPTDENMVLVGGVNTWRSVDGGTNWSIVNHWWGDGVQAVHADKHMLKYHDNGNLFECNDGGVYLSWDNGTAWNDKSDGLVISQMYKLGVSQTVAGEIITGLQDNGSKLISGGIWYDVKGGDGMECLIDYTDVNIQYATYVRGQITRTLDHWNTTTDIEPAGAGSGAWVTPYIIDPIDPNTIYAGYSNVWKTTDRGDNWQMISSMSSGMRLRSMAIAESNNSVLYVADLSNLWKTSNGGGSWSNNTGSLPVGSSSITNIAVKHNDENTVWVTMSGYNSNVVYESLDGGASWTNISTGLPELPAYSIVQNKQSSGEVHLYIGTELGVYFKKGSDNWIEYNTGLPNVKIGELEIYYDINATNSNIIAATYGRGLWETTVELPNMDFPVVKTEVPADITQTSATVGGNVTNEGASAVTERGIVWNTTGSPTTSDNKIVDGATGIGTYSASLGGLNLATKYYVRAYAINSYGTAYGSNKMFKTDHGYPYKESFEEGLDKWVQSSTDDMNWTITSGGTPSNNTGPNGAYDGSFYLYTEASGFSNMTASLEADFNFTSLTEPGLSFYYHMFGSDMGDLSVDIYNGTIWYNDFYQISGQQQISNGDPFKKAFLDLAAFAGLDTVTIRFRGLTGPSFRSDICIDNLEIFQIEPLAYQSGEVTQTSSDVYDGTTLKEIIGIEVEAAGNADTLELTQFTLNTTGTTNTSNVLNAKLFYTDTTNAFDTNNQFGAAVPNPDGTYNISGSIDLLSGTNYFWLTYDVAVSASPGNLLDAQCTGIVVDGNTEIPDNTNPIGAITIISAPVVSVDPVLFDVSVTECNDSVTVPLTISNTGGNDLNFTIQDNGHGSGKSISTIFAGGNGAGGNMFDITASSSIKIDSLEVHCSSVSSYNIRVYYKLGTYVGYESDSTAWTFLGGQTVMGNGEGNPVNVSIGGLIIEQGETYGLYVTATSGNLSYTNGSNTYSDGIVTINTGVGKSYPFGSTYSPRTWNGSIYYSESLLSYSSESGIITPGNSTNINVEFNSKGINAGTYIGDIVVNSNDPVNPQLNIPFTFSVSGDPTMVLSATDLAFGVLFVNDTKADTLWITNIGCDTLFVSNMSSSTSEFIIDISVLDIPPGVSEEVVITFVPTSVGNFNSLLTVYNNDVDGTINLTGTGIAAPELLVNKDVLNAVSECNNSVDHLFDIENTGGSELDFEITTISSFADNFENGLDNWVWTGSWGTTTNSYEGLGALTESPSGSYVNDMDQYIEMKEFLVINKAENSELSYWLFREMEGCCDYFRTLISVNQGAWQELEALNGISGWELRTFNLSAFVNNGDSIKIRFHFTSDVSATFDGVSIDNFEISGTIANWLSLSAESGTIQARSSMGINAQFDAKDLDPGTYSADVFISSNDPVNDIDTINCAFTVRNKPIITVSESDLHYGYVYITDTSASNITISNVGCDTLVISNIVSSLSEYSVDKTSMEILPGESEEVSVFFIPTANGSLSGILSIYSNDIDEPQVDLVITGTGTCVEITQQPTSVNAGVGDNVSFSVMANGSNLSYQWRFNTENIAGENESTYGISSVTADDIGNYDVIITDDCGSVVSNQAGLFIATSIENLSEDGIQIFPNPSEGVFNISYAKNIENVEVIIISFSGKVIYQRTHESGNSLIDLSDKAQGTYLIKFNYEGKSLVSRIILL